MLDAAALVIVADFQWLPLTYTGYLSVRAPVSRPLPQTRGLCRQLENPVDRLRR